MKVVKWFGIVVVVVFLGLQVFSPQKTNPPVHDGQTIQATTQVPPDVQSILQRACYDCHSSNTTWPWYSYIAPVSWLLVDDVNEGRRHLQFSEWGTYPYRKMMRRLQDINEQVSEGEMPLKSYLLMHPEARLSDADKQLLCDWAERERARMAAAQPEDPR